MSSSSICMIRIASPGIVPLTLFSSRYVSPDSRSSRRPRRRSTSAVLTAARLAHLFPQLLFGAMGNLEGILVAWKAVWKRARPQRSFVLGSVVR